MTDRESPAQARVREAHEACPYNPKNGFNFGEPHCETPSNYGYRGCPWYEVGHSALDSAVRAAYEDAAQLMDKFPGIAAEIRARAKGVCG